MRTTSLTDQLDALREQYLDDVLGAIHTVVDRCTPVSTLAMMTRYHLSTGGKRLRALIPLAVAQAMGKDPGGLVGFGAACEILHNATLVHDDLQDGDSVRRGQATIWEKFGAPQAINLGDAMLYYTLLLVGGLEFSAEVRQATTMRVLNETLRVIDGQEREFGLKQLQEPTFDDYFRMVEGKTSGLFALPMAGAAEICGADPRQTAALSRAAGHLGVLFQLQDDVLDLFADKGRERRGSDIAEGKITAMVVHAYGAASPHDAQWLREVIQKPRPEVGQDEIDRAIALLRACGSLEFTLAEIRRRQAEAVSDETLRQAPALLGLVREMGEVFLKPISALL